MSAGGALDRTAPATRAGLVLVVSLALVPLGCATLGLDAVAPAGTEVRPGAPADYDFLVGRGHELSGRLPEAAAAYRRALAKDPESAFLHDKLSEILARQGAYAESLAFAERAFELAPDDREARLFLASLYRLRRDVAGVERVLRRADGQPIDKDAGIVLFTVYLENDHLEQALSEARALADRYPDELRAQMSLAGVYERLGRTEDVERTLRDAAELHPGSRASILGTLARVRRERGDREGEVRVLRQILDGEPENLATRSGLAEALLALDRADEAIAVLEEQERRKPDSQVTLRLALLEYQVGRYESAARRLQAAFEALPEEYEIVYFLGLALQRIGDDEAAMRALRRIPREHERYADARVQLAAEHEREADYAAALAELERARAARPRREYDLYFATLQAKAGDFDGAVAFLEDLLREDPDDDEIFYSIGVLYGEAKRVDDALRYMQAALEKNPENASALNYVGYSWAERGENLDEAERLITRALDLRPDDGFIIDSLGWVYYMRAQQLLEGGRVDEGRAFLERAAAELLRAVELSGGDPVISEHLGDVHRLLGEPSKAFEYYEEAIRLKPRESEQPDLSRKHDELRRELGVQ